MSEDLIERLTATLEALWREQGVAAVAATLRDFAAVARRRNDAPDGLAEDFLDLAARLEEYTP